jgi:hypothetical protein
VKFTPDEVAQSFAAAKAMFRPTEECSRAGYILPDGTILDLSGTDGKWVPHNEVGGAVAVTALHRFPSDFFPNVGIGTEGIHFMEELGAMRVHLRPFWFNLEVRQRPTDAQLHILGECACQVDPHPSDYTLEKVAEGEPGTILRHSVEVTIPSCDRVEGVLRREATAMFKTPPEPHED